MSEESGDGGASSALTYLDNIARLIRDWIQPAISYELYEANRDELCKREFAA